MKRTRRPQKRRKPIKKTYRVPVRLVKRNDEQRDELTHAVPAIRRRMIPARTLLPIDKLRRWSATKAKNRWGALVREVRVQGAIAITSHGKIAAIIMEVGKYRDLVRFLNPAEQRHKPDLAELSAEFDRRLASLQNPDTRGRV